MIGVVVYSYMQLKNDSFGSLFFGFASLYTMLYYCCSCCAAKCRSRRMRTTRPCQVMEMSPEPEVCAGARCAAHTFARHSTLGQTWRACGQIFNWTHGPLDF